MATRTPRLVSGSILVLAALGLNTPAAGSDLARCLERQAMPRVVRLASVGEDAAAYALVVEQQNGVPTRLRPLADAGVALPAVLDLAASAVPAASESRPDWVLDASARRQRLCSPVSLSQAEIDAEQRIIVAAGLNYAAHADEAGGGDVFLFPKPAAPTPPYGFVPPPHGVTLLDYEVELAFVLLEDLDLRDLPSREGLLARSAFFVANDISDREPIIVYKAFSGPGTGFVDGKGQPGFLPAGPWLVRGTELFGALAACGETGLGLRLSVDEGAGFDGRQEATTAAMILDPLALLARLADELSREGVRSAMPLRGTDPLRYYPMAVPDDAGRLILPAGSVVLTGTPEGISMQAPDVPGVIARGLLRLRGPFEQFRQEELARAARAEPGGFLAPGDRVRAEIDGLGAQVFEIAEPGSPLPRDPCAVPTKGAQP